ncbi:hypothetical protein TcasGA2_TC034860 [Tribolium castaneum]|nr:hypothetical protein TcasGA2_TC034860 [Tribolium castaneum]
MQNTKTPSIQLIQTQRLEGGNPKLEYEKVTNFTRTRRKHRRFTESSLATPSLADILDKILLEDDEPQDRMSSILETCAKAVMRVIDKITIALSENCPEDETFDGSKRWWFKQEKAKNSDFYERMTKFLEKKNFSYETGDFFEYLQQNDKHLRFDDEFGDFAITKILFEIFCELLNFLHRNKPLDLPKLFNFKVKQFENDFFNHEATIKKLTLGIDKYFIKEWFVYISQDPTFCNESRIILEEVLTKMIKVQLNVDNESVIHGVLNLYFKHLKEFRRRRTNDLYRYSHLCSGSTKAKNYFIHQLTLNLLNHFIDWENSLPYQVLVSVISKRVMTHVLILLSNPELINYYILRSCASESKINELNLNNFNRVRIIQNMEKKDTISSDPLKSSETNLAKADVIEPQIKDIHEISCNSTSIWKDSIDVPDGVSLRGFKISTSVKTPSWYEEERPGNLAAIITKQKFSEPNSVSFGDLLNKILLEDGDETDSIQEEQQAATKELPEMEYFAMITTELRSLLEAQNQNFDTVLLESNDETDGVRSFCKSCAKTATGAIHKTVKTIKKVLPCDVAKEDRYHELKKWVFVEENATLCDLYQRLTKLFERKRNTNCDIPDSFESLPQNNKIRHSNIQFDDELDDFEVKLPITKTIFDILCELLADNKETFLAKEPVIQSTLLLFGNYIEETVVTQANYYLRYCCANAKIPSEGKIETLSMELEEFVTVVLSGIPSEFINNSF